jgi:hypothetical protein
VTSKTPLSDAALETFPEFMAEVRARLESGKEAYGDGSFEKPMAELVEEMIQEADDICGWGFVLHVRLKRLQERILELSSVRRPTTDAPRVGTVAPESGTRRGLSTDHGQGGNVDTQAPAAAP